MVKRVKLFEMVVSPCRVALSLFVMVGALSGLTGLTGCAPSSPARVTPVALRTAAPTSVSPQQVALAHVSSLPRYQQAEEACRAHHYRHAADLLGSLAHQHGLKPAEITFVQQQRALCLKDAGLAVPAPAEAVRALPSVASAPVRAGTAPAANADCGPRALLLLCERLGVNTTLPTLRQKAGTTQDGTSLAGLAAAAKAVGMKAEGVQVSREALSEIRPPALAYVNGNHFVAVLNVNGRGEKGTATIHDPNAAGEATISQERLLRLCSGYLLLVNR